MLSTMGGGGVKKWWKTVHVVYGWPHIKKLKLKKNQKMSAIRQHIINWYSYSFEKLHQVLEIIWIIPLEKWILFCLEVCIFEVRKKNM